jgi:hypothetical protein
MRARCSRFSVFGKHDRRVHFVRVALFPGNVQPSVDVADFPHFTMQNHLG